MAKTLKSITTCSYLSKLSQSFLHPFSQRSVFFTKFGDKLLVVGMAHQTKHIMIDENLSVRVFPGACTDRE